VQFSFIVKSITIVPHTTRHLGDSSFSVAGPRQWNSLPVELCQPHVEIGQRRRVLKTFLFERDCTLEANLLTCLLTYHCMNGHILPDLSSMLLTAYIYLHAILQFFVSFK